MFSPKYLSAPVARRFACYSAVVLILVLIAETAHAIPAFARRYSLSCTVCHVGFPKLNGFGEAFIQNGYQLPGVDIKDRLQDTGDDKLLLLKSVPLAVRADGFFRVRNDSNASTDIESPFVIKLLSSAPLKKDIAYYFYFLFDERGDVAGVEDAFIYFNDAYKGVDLDFRIGQFQVSDIVFPREQRLTFQDFTYFVTPVSDSGFVLTYDRAGELSYNVDVTDNLALGFAAGFANGNGIDLAGSDRNFDSDDFKNFYGKINVEVKGQTVGFYGYSGREDNPMGVFNEFYRVGPLFDLTFFDNVNVWGNFLYGEDDNGLFVTGGPGEIESWGGFAGVTYPFAEDWIFSLLYNKVEVDQKPELDAHTMTVNLTYYIMRNLKVLAEFTGDLEPTGPNHLKKEHTGEIGLVLAF